MEARGRFHNLIVAASVPLVLAFAGAFGCATLVAQGPAAAQTVADAGARQAKLDDLFAQLQSADEAGAQQIEDAIWIEWSQSGSAAMDLLLERGRDALAAGDTQAAIDHFTALIDHAPDFAEGWNARATAYFETGELGPAIADIGHALTLNPRHFGALAGLGMIFEELDKPQQALEVYRAALAIHPHLAGVREAVDRIEADLQGQDL